MTDIDDIKAAHEKVAGWYEPSVLPELHSSLASMRLAPGVHEGRSLLKRHGFKIAIISITWEFAVDWFAHQFGADYFVGTRLSPDGDITDSNGDLDMLRTVEHLYWVDSHLPAGLTAVHHPDGDIECIAQDIVAVAGW